MLRMRIRACRAADDEASCSKNASAHARVLAGKGIASITSARPGWWLNDRTYVLLLEDAAGDEPFGAIRFQQWGNGVPLPIEVALAEVGRDISIWLSGFSEGVGELCGLWCAPALKGFSLGNVMIRMGLSLPTQVGTNAVIGLCDTRHVEWNRRFGFAFDSALGARGSFEYPRPGLTAHVMCCPDARRLEHALAAERSAIVSYREAPVGSEIFESGSERLELAWDLRIAEGAEQSATRRLASSTGDGGRARR